MILLVVVDGKDEIIDCNKQVLEMANYTNEQINMYIILKNLLLAMLFMIKYINYRTEGNYVSLFLFRKYMLESNSVWC